MSLTYTEEVRCACGEVFETELVQSVSADQDPELKELILAGELNLVKCSSCFQMLYAERFVLYHDSSQELIAFVYPRDMETKLEEIRLVMGKSFAELQERLPADGKIRYKPFLLFGLDQLCALLKGEEEIGDEVSVADSLCGILKLSKRKIHLDTARRLHIPALLPLSFEGDDAPRLTEKARFRESVIAGLKKILDMNPHLEHYKRLLFEIETHPEWTPEETL